MTKLFLFLTLFLSIPCLASAPCKPTGTTAHPYCLTNPGKSEAAYKIVKVPQVYFYSNSGMNQAWLVADSKGTWRIRIMHWSQLGDGDQGQNHFHQVAHSDLAVSGPVQEIQYPAAAGFYRYEIECENDCAGKDFQLINWVP